MLQVDSINVYYGDVQVLYNVSLQVGCQEIVALLGSNGAGKTTTLKTITGLLKKQTGNISLQGKTLEKMPAYQMVSHGIAMVPEGRKLFPNMTVRENLMIGAFHPEAFARAKESMAWILDMFPRVNERLNQLAGTLSGGEQQMVAISRALMSRPRLLLLDEPSLGLAPNLVEQIFDTIQELNIKQGLTVLVVEQNAQMALQIAHRAYVLENGEIVLSDNADQLLNSEKVREAYLGL
ncbi:amino acid/amide ABC transporter ATP-binding protein 2, HAAT family (TC 3.A.1.4.-) [Desulfotomaculum arcticum]|uniref:Amino acid/amide ABC transporter ATP-binding protein 2, HAAT family (TC 3.A.1.4.-) n=1 Tax=Desulfotruncus arcticus DSM 17038 TaxID=1121424 RepID=A0A1I2PLV2_9FIRM|nr:ABC transporter ATP-binding protein [Desulfotruncus arcticus]SFG14391.1 amino acid/amide ABC transporter ATP-binding protein 2, HAAT family (TC 3.A.1.4.-) [Desulfotomaculum arcticum] [Desulfotruncus arcticus DSM 17038]